MKLKPLGDRVIVEMITKKQDETASGIVVVETKAKQQTEGTVVAVGPGAVDDDGNRTVIEVKVGDRVHFDPDYALPVTVDGKEYRSIAYEDILCTIEDE